jgi:hypothetical protein
MKGIFWNIRGMGEKGRKPCIMNVFRKHDIDFISIQETKTINFSDRYLNSLSGGKLFCWKWLPSTGTAGGILMGINTDVF